MHRVDGDGPRIDPDDRTNLFETRYTDRRCGLHVSSAIAEAHGWTISVSGSADGGARFDVAGLETR